MKAAGWALVFLAAMAASVSAADIAGTWKASLVDPNDPNQPRSIPPFKPTIEFKIEGGKLTGTVHFGNWLGDAEISEGTVDGDSFSFVTIAETKSTSGTVASRWTGRLHGDEMELTMNFPRPSSELKMTATKSP
jgi:hypothetical protein